MRYGLNIIGLTTIISLLTPIFPKIKFTDTIFLYPLDIWMILFPALICGNFYFYTKLYLQKILLSFSIVILLFSIISQLEYFDINAIFRSLKLIIYIPLVYLGFKSKSNLLNVFLCVSLISMSINFLHYILILYPKFGFEIWAPEALASGLSNRYIDFPFDGLQLTPGGGAHGIWGGYCILALSIFIYFRITKKIRLHQFYLYSLLFLTSLCLTVSRETLLTLFIYINLLLLNSDTRKFVISNLLVIIPVLVTIILFMGYYEHNIPLFEKLSYTENSINSIGTEGNIQARLNTWKLILFNLIDNPFMYFLGLGFNRVAYENFFLQTSFLFNLNDYYASVPESLIFFGLLGGGYIGLFYILYFIYYIFKISLNFKNNAYWSIAAALIALIPANIISGSSLISDLLFSQFLLIIGFLIQKSTWYEKNCNNS